MPVMCTYDSGVMAELPVPDSMLRARRVRYDYTLEEVSCCFGSDVAARFLL